MSMYIRLITLFFSISAIVLLFMWSRRGRGRWAYTFWPIGWLINLSLFVGYMAISTTFGWRPLGTVGINTWSQMIHLQAACYAFFMAHLVYKYYKDALVS